MSETWNRSYVEMPAALVRRTCEDCIARIQEHRNNEERGLKEAKVRRHNRSWWRRLLGLKPIDIEDVHLDTWEGLGVRMYAWGSLDVAEALLKLSKNVPPESTVHVTAADWEMIA